MCNEYQKRVGRSDLAESFRQLKIPIRWADAEPNRPLDDPIKPTNLATIIRAADPANPKAGLEGVDLRWWMVPLFHRGAVRDWKSMCTNARIETVDTAPAFRDAYRKRRCLVPVTSFIEYAVPEGWRKGKPKTRYEISWPGGDVRFFAGIWERSKPADLPDGLESFAFITGPAAPDVAPIHDRTPPVLTLEQAMQWLRLDGPGKAPLATPPPAGAFTLTVRPRDAVALSPEMRRALP